MSNAEVIRKAKISQDYYYTRTRYEKPFNTNDVDRIARVINVDPYAIFDAASAVADKIGKLSEDDLVAEAFADAALDPMALAALHSADKRKRLERPADEGA